MSVMQTPPRMEWALDAAAPDWCEKVIQHLNDYPCDAWKLLSVADLALSSYCRPEYHGRLLHFLGGAELREMPNSDRRSLQRASNRLVRTWIQKSSSIEAWADEVSRELFIDCPVSSLRGTLAVIERTLIQDSHRGVLFDFIWPRALIWLAERAVHHEITLEEWRYYEEIITLLPQEKHLDLRVHEFDTHFNQWVESCCTAGGNEVLSERMLQSLAPCSNLTLQTIELKKLAGFVQKPECRDPIKKALSRTFQLNRHDQMR